MVIAIIGILVALLLPAVQAARESARRAQCVNRLKQLGLACLNHENNQRFFPSSGWGMGWVGDPDRGFGKRQPGGWTFSLLPFIEQQNVFDMGRGQSPALKRAAATRVTQTPLADFHCPSRRDVKLYPQPVFDSTWQAQNADPVTEAARNDYAINSGTYAIMSSGPGTPAQATDGSFTWMDADPAVKITGISYQHSEISIADIQDGTTRTYLIGEKFLNPLNYETGNDGGDNLSMYQGHDWDVNRFASNRPDINQVFYPQVDLPGWGSVGGFGSPHPGGLNMVFCDGSVRQIAYEIDGNLHMNLADRADGKVTTLD